LSGSYLWRNLVRRAHHFYPMPSVRNESHEYAHSFNSARTPSSCARSGGCNESVQTPANKKLPKSQSIRWHLVERIKKEIAEGTYDTDEKLEKALDRFLDQQGY